MALRNRVSPLGEILAVPDRGLFFGNRGCLHDADARIVRGYASLAWICCLLRFKQRRRTLLQPGRYTELFFLDEATAFAAGHRPCAECRRSDYQRFRDALVDGLAPPEGFARWSAPAIDRLLHAARLAGRGVQRRWPARLGELPDGTLVVTDAREPPQLVVDGGVRPWSPGGYGASRPADAALPVLVLTPRPVVTAFARGYAPVLHPSARSGT